MINHGDLERAKIILEYNKAMCNFNPLTGENKPMNRECDELAYACKIALECIEKQIPKIPYHFWNSITDNDDLEVIMYDYYTCPMCGNTVEDDEKHCCMCGQQIDWSEVK